MGPQKAVHGRNFRKFLGKHGKTWENMGKHLRKQQATFNLDLKLGIFQHFHGRFKRQVMTIDGRGCFQVHLCHLDVTQTQVFFIGHHSQWHKEIFNPSLSIPINIIYSVYIYNIYVYLIFMYVYVYVYVYVNVFLYMYI